MTVLISGKNKEKLIITVNIKLKLTNNYLCICSLKSQAFSICLRRVGWPTSDFNCPVKMELARFSTIFSTELMIHLRFMHWLCGFTKYAQ